MHIRHPTLNCKEFFNGNKIRTMKCIITETIQKHYPNLDAITEELLESRLVMSRRALLKRIKRWRKRNG